MTSDSKVYGDNMGPIWGRQDPGGLHVGPMNFVIWGTVPLFSELPHPRGGTMQLPHNHQRSKPGQW